MDAIQTAISVLERLSEPPKKSSSLFSIREFFFATFSKPLIDSGKKEVMQEALLKAVSTLQLYHPVISHLQEGSPEEQKLAQSAKAAIARFNAVVANRETPSFTKWIIPPESTEKWTELGAHRFDMPIEYDLNQKVFSAFCSNLSSGVGKPAEAALQEIDVLRMKTYVLLKEKGLDLGSLAETLRIVKNAQIDAIQEAHVKVVTLIFSVLPGVSILVKGMFQNGGNSALPGIPLPKSFDLTIC